MAHATHSNAALTVRARLRLARLIIDDEWPIARAAERYDVSWKTAAKWARRYEAEGADGLLDRSSRPHHQPNKTPPHVVRKIVKTRLRQRLGPIEIGAKLGLPASTVHAVLTRCHLNRLTHIDRATGERVRRYEHGRPGDLIHVDVKKLGRVPDGGGHRYVGRAQGEQNRIATVKAGHATRNSTHAPRLGTCYLHTVIDDHSRVAYAEIHDDETALTATAVLVRAVEWFNQRGVTVERVLSDNGGAYRSHLWRDTCAELGVRHKRTRPYRPQTNGKIERFHRTLADGWAYARCYTSEAERRGELDGWLHYYNHHRPHTACGNQPPFSRLTNVPGQYI